MIFYTALLGRLHALARRCGADLFVHMCTFSLVYLTTSAVTAQQLPPLALMEMSLEELSTIRIVSVNRREESIANAPASIYVITSDDIRRSGATTLPQVLQLAPNLQVAQRDSVQYAITSRGFNNAVGNKLLVLVDGRTIYTPLFSGVFWEMQDTFLQDIERIEVISGPGATLWGANAVNGVINVITKSATETTGTLLTGEAGGRETGVALRTGVDMGADSAVRFYAKTREWDNTRRENGAATRDSWRKHQVGFRADWDGDNQVFTLQGDAYKGQSEHRGFVGSFEIKPTVISGMNLLARWSRETGENSGFKVQAYWNHNERAEVVLFSPTADILDLEFQQNIAIDRHRLVWGGGYRHAEDDVDPGAFFTFIPDSRKLNWQNIYLQDEITLGTAVTAILGVKLETNDFTGTEHLPSLSLAWTPADNQLLWLGMSRAVRAPSRFDRDVFLPRTPPYIIAGGPDFKSEVANVLEVGYRGQLNNLLNLSMTLYHHDWKRLRSGTEPPFPTYIVNGIEGEVYGLESWINLQLTEGWRVSGGLSTLDKDLAFSPGSGDTAGINNATLHNDPDYQWKLRSSMDLLPGLTLDLNLRRVDELPVEPVPAYTELNARLAWQPSLNVEIALTGRNLLDKDHAEFSRYANRSRIDRSILLGMSWSL